MVRPMLSRKGPATHPRTGTGVLQTTTAYRLGAVDVACQTDNEVVCDRVHQVPEAGIAIQHIIQGG